MLYKIERYRDGAFISNHGSWLFTILTQLEQGIMDRSNATRKSTNPLSVSSSSNDPSKCLDLTLAGFDNIVWPEEEQPNGFDISEAIELDSGVQDI